MASRYARTYKCVLIGPGDSDQAWSHVTAAVTQ